MAFLKNSNAAKGKAEVQADHGPRTADDWRRRTGELESDVVAAAAALTEARAQRRETAGNVIVFGATGDALQKQEDQEREAERRLDSQRAAVEVAKGELQKAEAAEEAAAQEERKKRRAAIAVELRTHAEAVDKAFAAAAPHLEALKALMRDLHNAGGAGIQRTLSGCVARAAYAAGLRGFLELGFVGGNQHHLPLAKQFEFLTRGFEPAADNSAMEADRKSA
jgi:hypothetical protein